MATTPCLDGDDSVLVGGAGNDLVIGGQGSNLMVGGFGFSSAGDHSDEKLNGTPTSTDRDASVSGDTAGLLAGETAEHDANDAPWASVSAPSDSVFTDVAATDVLDQVFGSTDFEVVALPGDEV